MNPIIAHSHLLQSGMTPPLVSTYASINPAIKETAMTMTPIRTSFMAIRSYITAFRRSARRT